VPTYRAMLDREGAAGPEDVAIVGDEAAVQRQVHRLAEAGATEFLAAPLGSEAVRVGVRLAAATAGGQGLAISLSNTLPWT
jgi:hypothetical protein